MVSKRRNGGFLAVVLVLVLTGIFAGLAPPAQAHRESVGLFHQHLAHYGNWVAHGKYGPVWYPTRVGSRWRPYLNGRWIPASEGWMFETSEPWGWATYHYGNWFPTTEYGWVWDPGSTWYPSTCAWRSNESYVGWAPIPPPDYVPEPAYYPEGGYVPGAPLLDIIASPLWLFAAAANLLLGFGQPYAPAYSYYGCNCLSPFNYGPSIYGSTFLLSDFYYPNYAPVGYYSFGPPFGFVSRVTHINITRINNYVKTVKITHIRNALPPRRLLERDPALRRAVPADLREGRRLTVHPVTDVVRAERELVHPNAVAPPPNVPKVTAQIPKAVERPTPGKVSPMALERAKGMALPRSAVSRVTPQARRELRSLPQVEQPSRMVPKREFRAGAPAPLEVRPVPREVRPAPREVAPPGREFQPAPRETFRLTPTPSFHAEPAPSMHPTPAPQFHPSMPREFTPAPRPEFHPAPAFRPGPAPAPRAAPAPRGAAPGRR